MPSKALVFDCDGVLIDAEQLGHLRAFNEMWQELQVPWRWTVEQYVRKLVISGGRERLASLRDDAEFQAVYQVPGEDAAWEAVVEEWHRRKTEIYVRLVSAGRLPPRSGVRRLAHEALNADWRLAVVSSGAPDSVRVAVRLVFGPELAQSVLVVDGGWAVRKKPSAEPYTAAADALGVRTRDCVVVEDSEAGLLAARGAGAACVVTPTCFTAGQGFIGASLVLSELGEPDGPPVTVLSNPLQIPVERFLRLDGLSDLLAAHERVVEDMFRDETILPGTPPEIIRHATGAQRTVPTVRNG